MTSVHGPMTPERKSKIWELWRQGRPMSFIAEEINKPPATVFSYLLYHGGIQPKSKRRRPDSLCMEERESISRGIAGGLSIRRIATDLGRAPSTVSREISRNGGLARYRACLAEKMSIKRARRPKPFLLVVGC